MVELNGMQGVLLLIFVGPTYHMSEPSPVRNREDKLLSKMFRHFPFALIERLEKYLEALGSVVSWEGVTVGSCPMGGSFLLHPGSISQMWRVWYECGPPGSESEAYFF